MGAVGFYIFRFFSSVLTLIPLKVLYLVSDLLYLIMYYIIRYRRKVVTMNLMNAFPGKTVNERLAIEKRFYRHMADLIIETLKIPGMSEEEIKRRVKLENPELLHRLYSEGKDVVVVLGHYNNWELLLGLPLATSYKCIAIYKPLKNKHFDRFMQKVRTRFGAVLTPMSSVLREIIRNRNNGVRSLSAFLADQTPAKSDISYWTQFLSQDTPVYVGAGIIASRYNMAVIFYNTRKVKRGYYSVKLELLFSECKGLSEQEITEAHVRRLDEIIREKPEYWIWSHRRWKHKRETS
jgi:KDO2-lipid IV(A) lauroyltransferase